MSLITNKFISENYNYKICNQRHHKAPVMIYIYISLYINIFHLNQTLEKNAIKQF